MASRPLALLLFLLTPCCGPRAVESTATEGGPTADATLPARALRVLQEAQRTELLALHPDPSEPFGMTGPGERDFHGFRVLARMVVNDEARDAAVALLLEGLEGPRAGGAACFHPRQGIRAQAGLDAVDVLVCFECGVLHVHGPDEASVVLSSSRAPEARLAALFRAEGLALHGDEQRVLAVGDGLVAPALPDAVVAVLEAAERFELFALHPFPEEPDGAPGPGDEVFHGFKVLAHGQLVNQGAQGQLVDLVASGVRAAGETPSDAAPGAECFRPRHGLRAVRIEPRDVPGAPPELVEVERVELVLSFECGALRVFGPGELYAEAATTGDVEPAVTRIFENGEAPVTRR